MKNKLFAIVIFVFVICLSLSGFSPVLATDSMQVEQIDKNAVMQTRFLNMLNHNFAYDADFDEVEDILNASVLSSLSLKEEGSDYIRDEYIVNFAYNMYGVVIEDTSLYNTAFPQKEGCVYVIPRGYSSYSHNLVSVTENEDGSYTVITNVTVSNHSSATEILTAETLFVVNENSEFGYNIVYSNLCKNTIDI